MSEPDSTTLDKQLRALSHLRGLQKLLEDAKTPAHISEKNVDILDAALDRLTELGEDVEEFRFPRGTGSAFRLPTVGPMVEKALLYAKVAGVLEYFAIRAAVLETAEKMRQEPARMIGFTPPRREGQN
jgi:hypothetical protein